MSQTKAELIDAKGNATFDTNTLFVDATNNRVGIGTTTPLANLHSAINSSSTSINTSPASALLQNLNATSGAINGLLFANSGGFGSAAVYTTQTQTGNSGDNLVLTTKSAGGAWNTGLTVDTAGRLLVGTSTSNETSAYIENTRSSGINLTLTRTGSLSNNEICAYGTQVASPNRRAYIGVYKHSGITAPCAYIFMHQTSGAETWIWTDDSGVLRISSTQTNIGTTSGTVVGSQTSDERLKNITGPVAYGLDAVKQLNPVSFEMKSEPGVQKLGFVAQEVLPLIPETVFDTKERIEGEPDDAPTKLGMEYVSLIPVLVNAIKELSAEVDALRAKLP